MIKILGFRGLNVDIRFMVDTRAPGSTSNNYDRNPFHEWPSLSFSFSSSSSFNNMMASEVSKDLKVQQKDTRDPSEPGWRVYWNVDKIRIEKLEELLVEEAHLAASVPAILLKDTGQTPALEFSQTPNHSPYGGEKQRSINAGSQWQPQEAGLPFKARRWWGGA